MFLARSTPTTAMAMAPLLIKDPPHIYEIGRVESIPLLTLGLIAVWQGLLRPELFLAWVILPGTFRVDATLTLVRRILRGEAFYEAHRSHAGNPFEM